MNHKMTAILAILLIASFCASFVDASSHREAPAITKSPKVDGTDIYMFRSYETGRDGFVTIIVNYLPLQDPLGGPNYFFMDPNALYEIHIDNNGDSVEDITFQFRFQNIHRRGALNINGVLVEPSVLALNQVTNVEDNDLNFIERYTVTMVTGDRRTGVRQVVTEVGSNASVFTKPFDNAGEKTLPSYSAYANQHIYDINIPGSATAGRMFVGQRREPFFVNLGETFDLINIANPASELASNDEANSTAAKNVTSFALELPISALTSGSEPVIGAWTTASLRQGRLLNSRPNRLVDNNASVEGGAWTQVSRLGNPLVNEVVIGLSSKDAFNASEPQGDLQFLDFVTNPTLPAIINILFPGLPAPPAAPRNDLVAVFLTGLAGLNQPANVVASEMLRLNTSISPVPLAFQDPLGVINGDNAGFPNGRRLGDDVVDIALRVAYGLINDTPVVTELTDGVRFGSFDTGVFPYCAPPLPGATN